MKKFLLYNVLLLITFRVIAQNQKIDSLKIIPNYITEDSSVKVVCYSYLSVTPCNVQEFEFTVESDSVQFYAKHENFVTFGATCNSIDTSSIGKFSAGLYTLIYNHIYYTDTIHDTIQFEVLRGSGNANSVEELSQSELSIYPNPSKGIIHIETNEVVENVELYNLLGKKVRNISLQNKQVSIPTYERGVYYLLIKSKSGIVYRRKVLLE